ncbi:hypothetical protein MAPG_10250 [Magnaporthiopsis poae ATCC 64411]|uniref:Ketosynthase family 3 (KS3) domain-containing protein n=1 Tax=Magnaporthiopsis poae (strain ATCC 64411 / 73-15) TaxID=644358 RepID=A0A0C4EC36_MAGP6|nr:hypothetical protein MAPG_10250 [Magnaporthiopsis poae ATCC 64411]
MPSARAQAALIRSTYARAGLDINRPEDRSQFFHTHGTGTPAGDPQEAEAISQPSTHNRARAARTTTRTSFIEGTAGLASLISTSLALQHSIIPTNMHFKPSTPRSNHFTLTFVSLPSAFRGQSRGRASLAVPASTASVGFDGTNAHAILEAYQPPLQV